MTDKQKFGLIMPKKAGTLKLQKSAIFNDESDDDDHSTKRPKIPQKKFATKTKIKVETLEDPSIYEYDNIYDEMKSKEKEKILPKEKKNSRYIETLLKAADKRKKEYEKRIDRKIQIEREKEGDEFKDKEAFVTSAYKKKMQEKEEEEERERRENMLNEMMDVTKQKDLSGFYRHFLNQTIGEEKVPVFGEKQIKQEVMSDQEESTEKNNENESNKYVLDSDNIDKDSDIEIDSDNMDKDSDIEIDSDESQSIDKQSDSEIERKDTSRKRKSTSHDHKYNHAKRKFTKRNSKENFEKKDKESYVDSDEKSNNSEIYEVCRDIANPKECKFNDQTEIADKLNDVSDSANNHDKVDKFNVSSHINSKHNSSSNKIHKHEKLNSQHDSSSDSELENKCASGDIETDIPKNKENSKRNIYIKRTVGEIFAEAQARYFQRLAARNLGI